MPCKYALDALYLCMRGQAAAELQPWCQVPPWQWTRQVPSPAYLELLQLGPSLQIPLLPATLSCKLIALAAIVVSSRLVSSLLSFGLVDPLTEAVLVTAAYLALPPLVYQLSFCLPQNATVSGLPPRLQLHQ